MKQEPRMIRADDDDCWYEIVVCPECGRRDHIDRFVVRVVGDEERTFLNCLYCGKNFEWDEINHSEEKRNRWEKREIEAETTTWLTKFLPETLESLVTIKAPRRIERE